jgi:hypothetical protein
MTVKTKCVYDRMDKEEALLKQVRRMHEIYLFMYPEYEKDFLKQVRRMHEIYLFM